MNASLDSRDPDKNIFLAFILHRKWRIARHALLILLIMLAFGGGKSDFVGNVNYYVATIALVYFMLFLYTNMYWLVPEFLFKGKYLWYGISALTLTMLTFFFFATLDTFLEQYRIVHKPKEATNPARDFLGFCVVFCILIAASTAVKLFQRWIKDTYRMNELERANLQIELDRLKSQINPHFLFNTLNNANVLTQTDPAKASQVLIKLSDLLRYQLYDSAEEQILLSADISFLDNFLHLEKIRRDQFSFSIHIEGNPTGRTVPPFLFIPFVENAVKHNMDAVDPSYVYTRFIIGPEKLIFSCENSKPQFSSAKRKTKGGLGLANIKRRLELCYGNQYVLHITEQPHHYLINLEVPL